jgi:hypothetical protein
MKDLPENLILDTEGNLNCKDGQNPSEYILNSRLGREIDLPASVVLLSREQFITICDELDAWAIIKQHLIEAA